MNQATQSDFLYARLLHPLTAITLVNIRLTLLRRKVLFPLIIVLLPLGPILFWRIVCAWVGPPPSPNGADPVRVYSLMSASLYLQFVVPLLSLLRGMSAMSEEIEDGTLIFLKLRPIPRTVIVFGKYLAYVISSGLLLSISLILTYLIASTMPDAEMLFSEFVPLIKDIGVFITGLSVYGAVMMVVGIFTKRSLLTGGFLLFIWDAFAAFIPGTAHKLTIKFYLQSIYPREAWDPAKENNILLELLGHHDKEPFGAALFTIFMIIAVCIFLTVLAVKFKEFRSTQQDAG